MGRVGYEAAIGRAFPRSIWTEDAGHGSSGDSLGECHRRCHGARGASAEHRASHHVLCACRTAQSGLGRLRTSVWSSGDLSGIGRFRKDISRFQRSRDTTAGAGPHSGGIGARLFVSQRDNGCDFRPRRRQQRHRDSGRCDCARHDRCIGWRRPGRSNRCAVSDAGVERIHIGQRNQSSAAHKSRRHLQVNAGCRLDRQSVWTGTEP